MTYTAAHIPNSVGIRELQGWVDELQTMRDRMTAMVIAFETRGMHYDIGGRRDEGIECVRMALDNLNDAHSAFGAALGEVPDDDDDYDPVREHGLRVSDVL